jgi:hypothetical protein
MAGALGLCVIREMLEQLMAPRQLYIEQTTLLFKGFKIFSLIIILRIRIIMYITAGTVATLAP